MCLKICHRQNVEENLAPVVNRLKFMQEFCFTDNRITVLRWKARDPIQEYLTKKYDTFARFDEIW